MKQEYTLFDFIEEINAKKKEEIKTAYRFWYALHDGDEAEYVYVVAKNREDAYKYFRKSYFGCAYDYGDDHYKRQVRNCKYGDILGLEANEYFVS